MGFLARPQDGVADDRDETDDQFAGLAPPDDEDLNESGVAARHRDSWLQTTLSPERLQRSLLKLYYDARTAYEERGVNVLYLALGFLEWRDAPNSDQARHAPLLLMPVNLERGSAHERFRLAYAEDEIITNLTLREKLKEFALQLPEIEDGEELVPTSYFSQVAEVVAGEPRFAVHGDDVVLGLFSFTRLLMYRDMDPANWPEGTELDQQPLVRALLRDGFRDEPAGISEEQSLDDLLTPLDAIHILDADSSQVTAIEEVRRGRNLLIQGPPGTGKSQTIANLIASAVHAGKKVLFVAEKMAALEVVHRRLSNLGVGAMCLELHSHKANKRAVLDGLSQTLDLGRPKVDDAALASRLADVRARLNDHANTMHAVLGPSTLTPFSLLGEFVRLARRGVIDVDFVLPGAVRWTHEEIEVRQSVIEELASLLTRIGSPSEHVWRGVGLDIVLPPDQARITRQVAGLADDVDKVQQAIKHLEQGLGVGCRNTTPSEIRRLLRTCQHLNSAPNGMDLHALRHPVWRDHRERVAELVALGQAVANGSARLKEIFSDQAWAAELGQLRLELASRRRSWLRWLSPTYRNSRRALASLLVGALPRSIDQQLALLDGLLELRQAEERLTSQQTLGVSAFGRLWDGKGSDWQLLAELERWERDSRDERLFPHAADLLLKLGDQSELVTFTEQISKHFEDTLAMCKALHDALQLDLAEAFGHESLDGIELSIMLDRVKAWESRIEDLDAWLNYRRLNARARALDLAPLLDRLYDGRLSPSVALDALSFAMCEPLVREAWGRFPILAGFDGLAHDQRVERFRQLDKERVDLAAAEVALAHFQGLPKSSGDVGEMRVLMHEFKKRRRHLPIRKLIGQAGQAIQAIKPVFMMSPLSVAEFLAPGGLRFDLLLIDEASQVEPVDALGAVARADRMVVVGDDRQLPPTKFFKGGHLIEDDSSEEQQTSLGDIESILGKCAAQGMPQRMLRWHYRSRHPSLIAVSNQEFYDSRLFVVPNAQPDSSDLGLRFRHLPNAVYDRGGARWNLVEAKAVAEAVMRHASEEPELSLGVGCFSMSQRDAVLHELERLRRSGRDREEFFASHPEEPFFVKNLENIQGDERDVIMISIGYGRDASGYMAMSFGPINADGGERRLNVLISRAKRRCEVFSSITADDIDLARAPKPGVRALKAFLKYAETGVMDVPLAVGNADSVFEEQVAAALTALGHEVDLQVGSAGFFVDLAVRDPARPGRYLLGIECDGAPYHRALSARDRDRLRQQVLEDHGWIIHRIWSTDWFRQPQKQLARVVEALEAAKLDWAIRDRRADKSKPRSDAAGRIIPRDSNEPADPPSDSLLAMPYLEANFTISGSPEPHLLPRGRMADVIRQIVEIEGPVHPDEIARRVTRVCGYARTGKRIVDAVATGLRSAVEHGIVAREGDFICHVDGRAPTVRDRSSVQSPSLRKPEMLPPMEIRAAALQVIRTHLGVSAEEVVTQVSRMLGFQSTSAQLRGLVQAELDRLVVAGLLEQKASGAWSAPLGPDRFRLLF
jgi:very-short-patch-repair endonuclease/DNA polymerase III delta prime subunit